MKDTLDLSSALPRPLRGAARSLLGLAALERFHASLPEAADGCEFARAVLERLHVRIELNEEALAAIPRSGPLVFVSNHPFGGLDGLAALALLGRIRPDVRVLANAELGMIAGLAGSLIAVDPYSRSSAQAANAAAARRALRWVKDGGALLLFPAGEVARIALRKLAVADPLWSTGAARLVRMSGASVVPLRIEGTNGIAFLASSLVHPRLGTWLLPREILRRRSRAVEMRVGAPIAPPRLRSFRSPEDLTAFLRLSSDLLGRARPAVPAPCNAPSSPSAPGAELLDAIPGEVLEAEIAGLAPSQLLAKSSGLQAWCARAAEIPAVMQEVGRLRELSFRAVGEGTGRAIDLDLFDNYYDQIVLWDPSKREIVGGYRVGKIDEIVRRYGKRGLYTSTLFDYREPFLALLGPALELGRSFVHPRHQRSFAPLLLLWRAIGEYVGRQPRYCRLLGPVSVSNAYHAVSKELLVDFLRASSFDPLLASLVRPRSPFRGQHALEALGPNASLIGGIEGLSSLVADFEPDAKGVPVLLRQYLKLGGRILGFNVDRSFGDALDCLLLVDLRETDPATLARYLSEGALEKFRARHGERHRYRRRSRFS